MRKFITTLRGNAKQRRKELRRIGKAHARVRKSGSMVYRDDIHETATGRAK